MLFQSMAQFFTELLAEFTFFSTSEKDNNRNTFNIRKFVNKLDFEMQKLWYLQRLALAFKLKQKENYNCNISQLLVEKYGVDTELNQISFKQFQDMLIKLDLLPEFYADENVPDEDKYEIKYFIDEYFKENATSVSAKKI
jgi:hypothetical protein